MTDPTRTAIVCTRVGDRLYVAYLNDLDADVPYVNCQDFSADQIPMGMSKEQIPGDGQTAVVLTRWTKELEIRR